MATNWIDIQKQFNESVALDHALTLKRFCASKSINYGTARRHIKTCDVLKKSETEKSHVKACDVLKKNNLKTKGNNKTSHDKITRKITKKSHEKSHEKSQNPSHFKVGNQAAITHGGYSQYLPIGIVDDVLATDLTDLSPELFYLRSKMMQAASYQQKCITDLHKLYSVGKTKSDKDGNELTLSEALLLVDLTVNESIKVTANAFAKMQSLNTVRSKAKAANDQEHIIKNSIQNNESALKVARKLEANGLLVPQILLYEAKKEIDSYEPIVDEEGLTDDQLDELTNQYREKQRRVLDDDLPQQKEELEQRIAEFEAIDAGVNNVGTEQSQSSTEDRWGDEDDLTVYAFDDLSDFDAI